jgi:hypothetical protein
VVGKVPGARQLGELGLCGGSFVDLLSRTARGRKVAICVHCGRGLEGYFYSSIRGGIHLQVCLPPIEAFSELAPQRGQLALDRDVLEETNC